MDQKRKIRKIPVDREAMTFTDAKGAKNGYHMRDSPQIRHRILNQLIKRHSLLTVRRMLQARLNISGKRINPIYAANAQADLDWMKVKSEKDKKKKAMSYDRAKPKSKLNAFHAHALSIKCIVKAIGKQKTLALLRTCLAGQPRKLKREVDYIMSI